jgi:multidrug efflux pump
VISRFFIDRPIFATVLSVVITLVGLIALVQLPIAQYPRITPPGVAISISYPGASAQVLADTVAAPIEQQVNGVEGMLYMSAQMGNDGTYTITVTFDIGTDLKTALVMVQNRVALAMPQLPLEVQRQGITIRKKTPDMLMIVNLFSPDHRYDDIYLSNYATINLKDQLLRLDGVSDITYQGLRDYSVRAWLDPERLSAYQITAVDVANAIRRQNLDVPAGQVGQPPSSRGQLFQWPVNALGSLTTPEEFGDIIVKVDTSRVATAPALAPPRGSDMTSPGASSLMLPSTLVPADQSASAATAVSTLTPVTIAPPTTPTSGVSTSGGGSASGGSTSTGGGTTTGGAMGGATTAATTTTPTTSSTTTVMSALSINRSAVGGVGMGAGILTGETLGRGPGKPSASIVRLRDVARLELGAQNYNQSCTFDGEQAVGLGIFQLPGTNALDVADGIRAKMEELKTQFPDGVDYQIAYDTTPYIRESLNDVMITFLEAVALVGIVVLVFLQDWRAMILPMIDVPVSIIGTFAVMGLLGYSLNNISMFGLVLAIGIVVDDAIVVLENIERMMARGYEPRTATIKAMDEVTGPIVAVSLVLCAVFVPCALIPGITGQFFRQFAVTISVSTVISAINAVTMTPSRAVLIFERNAKQGGHAHHREALPWWFFGFIGGILTIWFWSRLFPDAARVELASWANAYRFLPGAAVGCVVGLIIIRPVNRVLAWAFGLFNRAFDAFTGGYSWMIDKSLRRSGIVLAGYGLLLILTVLVYRATPTGFIPQQDQGRLIVNIQLPDAASLERTKDAMKTIDRIARETPGVGHTVGICGLSFLLQANSPNFASMFIVLKPFDERQDPSLRDTAIMANMRKEWAKHVMDAKVTVFGASPIPGLGSAGGYKFLVEDRGGRGLPDLQYQTDAIVNKLRKMKGMNSVTSMFRSTTPQMYLDIDRAKVASLGVSLNDVNQTLDMYLGSLYVNSFNDFGRHWQVTVQAEGKYRDEIDKVRLFKVRNNKGQMVSLGTMVTPREIGGPLTMTRYNLSTSAAVNGNAQEISTGDAIDRIKQLAADDLPASMKIEWTELMYLQIRAGDKALYAFLLSILCVFLALAALYESWSLPLAVILVVPLCLLCSVGGVLLTGRDRNIFVQIGLVVLVGLACKNAILIVEYARQLHREGRSIHDATQEASRLRLRPILMTSFAFIFGVVPLITASGAGAEMRRSLGVAVFSGMLGVTVFGIFLTPVFFAVIQRLGQMPAFLSEKTQKLIAYTAGIGVGVIAGLSLDELAEFDKFLAGWGWRAGLAKVPLAPILGGVVGFVVIYAVRGVFRKVKPRLYTLHNFALTIAKQTIIRDRRP